MGQRAKYLPLLTCAGFAGGPRSVRPERSLPGVTLRGRRSSGWPAPGSGLTAVLSLLLRLHVCTGAVTPSDRRGDPSLGETGSLARGHTAGGAPLEPGWST